jgi:hypothetical protein
MLSISSNTAHAKVVEAQLVTATSRASHRDAATDTAAWLPGTFEIRVHSCAFVVECRSIFSQI